MWLNDYLNQVSVVQWVRTLAPQAEVWVFEFQPWKTYVVKTGSDSSIAKRSAIGVSVTVLGDDHYKRMPLSQYVWHAKEPSLLNGHECRA